MKNDFVKKLTRTALLLAIVLASQYFKNLSQFITGPIVNAVLIIAALGAGLWSGVALSFIAPLTSLMISQPPVMAATHFMLVPVIMIGNLLIVLGAHYGKKNAKTLAAGLLTGSVLKWLFMWGAVSLIVIPVNSQLNENILSKVAEMFTHFQLYTALIGSFLAYIIWQPLKKALKIQ